MSALRSRAERPPSSRGLGARRGGRRRRFVVLALVACAVVVGSGCQVRTDVDLAVRPDGSGTVQVTVTLDREAAEQIPDLGSQLRVDDLRRAGWRLVGPTRTAERGLRVSASKRFGRAEQAGGVLAELGGRTGPFRDFDVGRSHSFARTTWTARGTVDLQQGIRAFGDDRLTRLLGGQPFGRSETELRRLAHGSLADAAPFTVRVRLPGAAARTSIVRLGDQPLPIDAVARKTNSSAYLLAGGAALAVAAAVVLLILQALVRRRPSDTELGMVATERRRYDAVLESGTGPVPSSGGTPSAPETQPPDDDPRR